ncbi:MAG: hypothetical protein U0518_03895 [Candidatus Gracilibacteria bacterium]
MTVEKWVVGMVMVGFGIIIAVFILAVQIGVKGVLERAQKTFQAYLGEEESVRIAACWGNKTTIANLEEGMRMNTQYHMGMLRMLMVFFDIMICGILVIIIELISPHISDQSAIKLVVSVSIILFGVYWQIANWCTTKNHQFISVYLRKLKEGEVGKMRTPLEGVLFVSVSYFLDRWKSGR